MADINLKRFVDIDIEQHVHSTVVGTRGTVVLYTSDGTAGTTRLIESIGDATAHYGNMATTMAYLNVFFNNGGVSVLVIEGVPYTGVTNDVISNLEDKYIIIASANADTNNAAAYTALKGVATTRAADTNIYGINEKIILGRTTTIDETSVKNFAVKYSTILGAEMAIAAYLSRINVYRNDSVADYAFTQETITAEKITDTVFGQIIDNDMNVDIYLANSTRNMGGNLKDGSDIVNSYVKIILHQTLTDRLITLLTSKIKGAKGLSQIYATIAQELESYRDCGYLTTDKIWTDDDLTVTYNNQNYTVIAKGTALVSGYVIKVLPLSALTTEDKAERKAPPVYVIIADQYGIRKITINGEVI